MFGYPSSGAALTCKRSADRFGAVSPPLGGPALLKSAHGAPPDVSGCALTRRRRRHQSLRIELCGDVAEGASRRGRWDEERYLRPSRVLNRENCVARRSLTLVGHR